MKKSKTLFPPLVFNVFKPARMTSYDVVRHFKRHLPMGFGKIGHFGTLDPFASGVLMIGIGGAARLNDYVHDLLPKTYMAVGKLGIETPTGDYTSEIIQKDNSSYLTQNIASFSKDFIQEALKEKFLGEYWQAPHKYSASKFMGKNLHEWAREGVEIKKEPVRRYIHSIKVVKYSFPYLSVKVTVSSGTYVRTLFSDFAQHLGTIGSLISLVRESVGHIHMNSAVFKKNWPVDKNADFVQNGIALDHLLHFSEATLSPVQEDLFRNGAFLKSNLLNLSLDRSTENVWMKNQQGKIVGLAIKYPEGEVRPKINFGSTEQDADSFPDVPV